jgi:hypothetical protein
MPSLVDCRDIEEMRVTAAGMQVLVWQASIDDSQVHVRGLQPIWATIAGSCGGSISPLAWGAWWSPPRPSTHPTACSTNVVARLFQFALRVTVR